jgi:hypothetical protein
MKKHSLLVAMLTAVLLLGLVPAAAAADDGPTTQICIAIDGSFSIASPEWTIMLNGIAAAIEDPDCVPRDGSLELTVVEFSEVAELEVGPVVITSANAATVAEQIRNIGQQKAETNMWLGFDECRRRIVGSENFAAATKQIINVTTDGVPTEEGPPYTQTEAARDAAIAAGVNEIDAEAVGPGADPEWMRVDIVHPQPGTYAPPYAPPGWVGRAETFQEFATGVCNKFPPPEEDGFVPEAGSIVLLASGLMGVAGYAGLRLRRK